MYKSMLYGSILTAIIIALSAVYIFKRTFTREIIGIFLLAEKRYLLLALFSMFLYHTFDNVRLFVLSRAMGLKYSFFYGYMVSLINTFGATVTPAHMGGEFVSLYTLMRRGGQLHKVMSIVTMKTLTGISFFIVAMPLTFYTLIKNPSQARDLFLLLGIALTAAGALYMGLRSFLRRNSEKGKLSNRIKNTLRRYIVTMRMFLRDKKKYIFCAVVSSVLLYISFLAVGTFLVKAFNPEANSYKVFVNQLFLVYALFVSPTPGGSGVGELGALSVFSPFLSPVEVGVFALLWRFTSQYLSALIGSVLLSILLFVDSKKLKHGTD
ncbi:MAG: flippase-like domain-containing protein [Aquificaceae bacterium]